MTRNIIISILALLVMKLTYVYIIHSVVSMISFSITVGIKVLALPSIYVSILAVVVS